MPQRHYIVHGRVQGVSFRWFTQSQARVLGLTGWVRNRRDGTVEVLARGNVRDLEDFEGVLREGPAQARVDRLETVGPDAASGENASEPEDRHFEILPTR